jgi:hypothetical protein
VHYLIIALFSHFAISELVGSEGSESVIIERLDLIAKGSKL